MVEPLTYAASQDLQCQMCICQGTTAAPERISAYPAKARAPKKLRNTSKCGTPRRRLGPSLQTPTWMRATLERQSVSRQPDLVHLVSFGGVEVRASSHEASSRL
jgi:hypothetical protein